MDAVNGRGDYDGDADFSRAIYAGDERSVVLLMDYMESRRRIGTVCGGSKYSGRLHFGEVVFKGVSYFWFGYAL